MKHKQAQPMMTELLREALAEADSVRAVARATGVAQPSLARFLAGKQSLRLNNADALARHFGIRVSRPQRRRRE